MSENKLENKSENTKISLRDFILNMKDSIDDFHMEYQEHRLDNPEDFPLELSEEDWFEQYLIFYENYITLY